ncbi:MAG TPA: hypothetical protein PKI01_04065 [Bacteroidales bacterium]|nr:hypothetical protein [Bacteroidales bacterium]
MKNIKPKRLYFAGKAMIFAFFLTGTIYSFGQDPVLTTGSITPTHFDDPEPISCGNKDTIILWELGGNALQQSIQINTLDWIGTCNEYPFKIRTNNIERFRIKENGNVGIGTPYPNCIFSVKVREDANVFAKAASFASHGNEVFICPNNVAGGYSWETKKGDACIFWSDGLGDNNSNQSAGLVIAPAIGSHNGIRITPNGNFLIGKPDNINEALFKLDVAGNIHSDGCVGINTTTFNVNGLDYKLAVNGKILAKEIVVETNWSDFVFEKDYSLMPLSEVEKYIAAHKHLPDVPSAGEVEKNGVALGQTQSLLLQKIEELTLYTIEINKQLELLKAQNKDLQNEVNELKKGE